MPDPFLFYFLLLSLSSFSHSYVAPSHVVSPTLRAGSARKASNALHYLLADLTSWPLAVSLESDMCWTPFLDVLTP